MGHCELESPIPQNWMGSLQSNGSRSKKSAVEFKYIRRGRGKNVMYAFQVTVIYLCFLWLNLELCLCIHMWFCYIYNLLV